MRNFLVFCLLFTVQFSIAQTADEIVAKLKAKLVSVKDYEAIGKLKTDVAFLKIPISAVRIFYKYPDQFRIKKDGGISVLPKGGIKVNMSAMIADGNYTALLAGRIKWKEQDLAMLKLIPNDMNSDVVITTLYVDDKEMLIRKSITSTKENGTYEMEMDYGKYAKWGLPDKAIMIFNTKDYKLPKGITFEYDAGVGNKQKSPKPLSNKGRIEISYQSYEVNKGLKPEVFTAKN
jgi:outer membrane lipoprotein-sorting protein